MSKENEVVRGVYRAELKPDVTDVTNCIEIINQFQDRMSALLTVSLFRWDATLFLYVESVGSSVSPEDLFGDLGGCLKVWPNGSLDVRYWVPMMDIFHYSRPQGVEHWRRKTSVEMPYGRVIRLRPEKVSSYIFYHYQLQEERPGGGDKYGLIAIHEDLLFFYQEQPRVKEETPAQPSLKTSHTPPNWAELMSQHFAPWADPGEPEWRPITLLASVGLPVE
ncbi:MAG: hypothetical protein ACI8V2_001228 [Candidatus Latescibacterota bacterium]|jgi:hypothetical protein